MKFPVEVYLEDTSPNQENGLRIAIAKNRQALKALKAGGYVEEKPKVKAEKPEKAPSKPSAKAK